MREPENATPEALLEAGIQALKIGWQQDAQNLIFKAIARDPTNAEAWLWMAEAYTELEERIRCLEQVVSLEPDNEKVQDRLRDLRDQQIQGWIEEGFSALERDDPAHARERFLEVVDVREENLDAWWGLAQASESVDDQVICLENVLTLDPDHTEAREWLSKLPAATENVAEDTDLAWETRKEEGAAPLDLEDELACPYCGYPTEFEDRACEACGHRLWVKEQKSTPIPLYWILTGLELATALIGGMIPLLLLSILDAAFNGVDLQGFFAFFFGGGATTPDLPLSEIVAPSLAWLSLAPVALSLLALLCSASRWSPAYLVGSVLSAMRALVGLGMILIALTDGLLGKPWTSIPSATPAPGDQQFLTLMTWGVPVGSALIAGLSGVSIWAMMNLHTHFAVETKRMLLVIDRDVAKRETGLWLRAREYAKRKAWALAALHVRQALAYRRTVERYLLLAAAYYHLGQRDRARDALFDAQEIQPDHPRIAAMLEQIEHPPDA